MKKIPLYILSISGTMAQNQNYAILLGEVNGRRRLPIIIGMAEAQAIAVVLENITPKRPLTHDLFKNTLEAFDIELKEVIISDLIDGTFYALLICERNGEILEIDSRASDALALAVRFNCPIHTYDFILDTAGISLQEPNEIQVTEEKEKSPGTKRKNPDDFSNYPLKELRKILDKLVENENYEKAALVRDEINRRKQLNS